MGLKRSKSIHDALTYVAKHPAPPANALDASVWELVGRSLFDIANRPDPKVKGSLARATKAQKILLDRMVGRRRPGTQPITGRAEGLEFDDLTRGAIDV